VRIFIGSTWRRTVMNLNDEVDKVLKGKSLKCKIYPIRMTEEMHGFAKN
jgi:hypothetical protein